MRTIPFRSCAHGGIRRGFTFVELMVALTVAAAVLGIAIPRMAPMRDSAGVRASKQVVTGYLATARQAAVRRGAPATFHVDGNRVWVTASGVSAPIAPEVSLKDQNNVIMSGTVTSVTFNPRGLARLSASQKLVFQRGRSSDSLCVSMLGMLARCGL